jgi:hypothetical protein
MVNMVAARTPSTPEAFRLSVEVSSRRDIFLLA